MFGNVFLKSMYDQRRVLLGWAVGIILLVALMIAMWPSVRDMPKLDEFLASYPKAMRELFNLEDYATGAGYLNAELFTLMLPVLFIIFGIARGARMIAGEEEAGTLDVLLVTPVSAARLVLQKAAALVVALLGLGILLFLAALVGSQITGMGIGAGALATASLAVVLLGVEYGCLALTVGAATGRRAVAIGLPATAAVAAYVLYAAGTLVDAVEPWQPMSPFSQALTGGPVGAGLPLAYVWMAVGAIVFIAAGTPIFDRRDVATH